jgi:WD40 repeat protein
MTSVPHNIPYDGLEGPGQSALFTTDTHPSANILAAGEVSGKVTLYRYSCGEDCEVVSEYSHHTGHSCRALQFSARGTRLYSGTSGSGSLYVTDTETGTLSSLIKNAHSTALYSLCSISERLLASGDESGEVKVWDSRSWKSVMSVHENKDFISDMECNRDSTTLLATSGDGTLSAFDLRQKRLEQRSDPSESELLSLAIVKVLSSLGIQSVPSLSTVQSTAHM